MVCLVSQSCHNSGTPACPPGNLESRSAVFERVGAGVDDSRRGGTPSVASLNNSWPRQSVAPRQPRAEQLPLSRWERAGVRESRPQIRGSQKYSCCLHPHPFPLPEGEGTAFESGLLIWIRAMTKHGPPGTRPIRPVLRKDSVCPRAAREVYGCFKEKNRWREGQPKRGGPALPASSFPRRRITARA